MIILVDMDGTIANWGAKYDAWIDTFYEEAVNIPRTADQRDFDLTLGMSPREQEIIREVMDAHGFYRHLEPLPYARQALREMMSEGHEVFIVTSPTITNPTCAQDKFDWMDEYIGPGWSKRTVITKDKTLVWGDILFDDKPTITGALVPKWEHVLFDQPYNRGPLQRQRRISDWTTWRDFV